MQWWDVALEMIVWEISRKRILWSKSCGHLESLQALVPNIYAVWRRCYLHLHPAVALTSLRCLHSKS